jgi:class 3 adenylate cyclase
VWVLKTCAMRSAAFSAASQRRPIAIKGFVYRDLSNNALVTFGYPEAHEHDAEQAIRAGLELCAAVRTLRRDADPPVWCRVGIATGVVIVDDPDRVSLRQGLKRRIFTWRAGGFPPNPCAVAAFRAMVRMARHPDDRATRGACPVR